MAQPCSNIQSPKQWVGCQLAYGGYPQTASNRRFLLAWYQSEGGNWHNDAKYNPLNTTYADSSSGTSTTINKSGVRAYSSWTDGLYATASTFNGSNFSAINKALQRGTAGDALMSGALDDELQGTNGWCPNCPSYASTLRQNYQQISGGSIPSWQAPGPPQNLVQPSQSSGATGLSLMGDCHAWGMAHNNGKSSCLVNVPGPWCWTACEAKALLSGLIVLGGGLLTLAGVALLFEVKLPGPLNLDQGSNDSFMAGVAQGQSMGPNARRIGRSVPARSEPTEDSPLGEEF